MLCVDFSRETRDRRSKRDDQKLAASQARQRGERKVFFSVKKAVSEPDEFSAMSARRAASTRVSHAPAWNASNASMRDA
jgi:hypothetical protein